MIHEHALRHRNRRSSKGKGKGKTMNQVATRGRPPKQPKQLKKEVESPEVIKQPAVIQSPPHARPAVEIVSCISYQKFRYSGENRPGKKYQEKDFMELKLTNLGEKVVRIVIICTDAENKELIHPNGLVGKDCHDGIYDKEYAVTKQVHNIKIPYLRTERIKTKKNEHAKIRDILKLRAGHLPSPYRERCESQCTDTYTFNRKFDTTKVCLGVIVTVRNHFQGAVNGSLHAISHVVNNASEKTSLGILKLSRGIVSPFKPTLVDVFTTEDGPAIENDKYVLYVTYETEEGIHWESEKSTPGKEHILYKRIISYRVPPFGLDHDFTRSDVECVLHLDCPQSNQSCEYPIFYTQHGEGFIYYDETPSLKRSFTEDLEDIKPPKYLKLEEKLSTPEVKAALKESLKRREDDRRISYAPTVQIIQTSDEGALVRRSDPQTTHVDMTQDSSDRYNREHNTITLEEHPDQFEVLAAAYSNSVPSNTVVIITNGSEDIENAIKSGVSYFEKPTKGSSGKQPMIIIDSSNDMSSSDVPVSIASSSGESQQMYVVPDSQPSDDNKGKQRPSAMSVLAKDQVYHVVTENGIQQVTPKVQASPAPSKKLHKTDSPWAVASDDDTDYAYAIFGELSLDKQPGVVKKAYMPTRADTSDKSVLQERQRTISILSSKRDSVEKVITREMEAPSKMTSVGLESAHLDFSDVQLPSDINILNSEHISKYEIVKEVNKDLQ